MGDLWDAKQRGDATTYNALVERSTEALAQIIEPTVGPLLRGRIEAAYREARFDAELAKLRASKAGNQRGEVAKTTAAASSHHSPSCDTGCSPSCGFIQDFESAVKRWSSRAENRDRKPSQSDLGAEMHLTEQHIRSQVHKHYRAKWVDIRSAIQQGETGPFSRGFSYPNTD